MERITILVVNTWVVKPEKEGEFTKLWQRYLKYIKENPKTFKEVKSLKLFTQMLGGIYGAHVELIEYDSLTDLEKLLTRIFKDKEFMKVMQEIMLIIEPASYSINVWNAVT